MRGDQDIAVADALFPALKAREDVAEVRRGALVKIQYGGFARAASSS